MRIIFAKKHTSPSQRKSPRCAGMFGEHLREMWGNMYLGDALTEDKMQNKESYPIISFTLRTEAVGKKYISKLVFVHIGKKLVMWYTNYLHGPWFLA